MKHEVHITQPNVKKMLALNMPLHADIIQNIVKHCIKNYRIIQFLS